jgi:hypothetical protein
MGMNASFGPDQFHASRAAAMPALLFHQPEDDPQTVRIGAAQQLLFPTSPRALCAELHLNWWAVLKLFEDGWLSFSPETTPHLDEAQEAELRFIGALVMAGCDRNMLAVLLSGLPRPYAYDLKRLYFDWVNRRWRVLPDLSGQPETAFAEWLEILVHARDLASLHGLAELVQDASARIGNQAPELPVKQWNLTTDVEEMRG